MSESPAVTYHLAGRKRQIFKSSSQHDLDGKTDLHEFQYLNGAHVPCICETDEYSETKVYDKETFRSGIDILVATYDGFSDDEKQQLLKLSTSLTPEQPLNYNDEFREIEQNVTSFLTGISKNESAPKEVRTLIYPPHLPTTTGTYSENLFLGMHLDNIDERYPESRRMRRQRLLLNVSTESRVFLYGDLPFENFEHMKRNTNAQLTASNSFDIGTTRYFHLAPFEFCIVPTETLFHDGSTWFCNNPIVTLTGLFDPDFSKLEVI